VLLRGAACAVPAFAAEAGDTPDHWEDTQLIPRRLLFADPEKSTVRISPDGARIAFRAPFNGVPNLWVAPIEHVEKARPFTQETNGGIAAELFWMRNNRHVLFFREQDGDENWRTYRVDLQDGGIIPLTPDAGVKSYIQELSDHFPDEVLIADNRRDKRFFEIFRINAMTGDTTLLQANDRYGGFFTDRQFAVRYAHRFTDDGGREYLQPAPDGKWEVVAQIDMTDAMTTRPVEISDDGKELYWLDSRGRDKAAVVAQDLATGAMRVLAEDADADCNELLREPISLRPIAAYSAYQRRRWRVIDPVYAEDFARLAAASTGDLAGLRLSADKRNWLAYFENDASSGQYFHYDRAAKKTRFLFSAHPTLDRASLVPMKAIVVRARDGLDLVCYLSQPSAAENGAPLPMVLLVHGGPWSRDEWGLNVNHQWLANRGYAVLSVNFRGSTGFGKPFINAANLEWGGKMHDDLIDAVDWAIGHGIADPNRVAIFGRSYGGYAALAGLTFTPDKFACAVDMCGISNLVTMINTIPPYWKPWQTIWKARMGDYTSDAGRTFLEERSPLNHVERIVRPLLIGQGANDVRVKPSESEQIVSAMQQRGIPVTYVYYANEGHFFRRPANRASFNAVAEAFLAKHLGGRCEPVRL
jgi:dipeptidyl aminopeptidase/acylaminoacyl peptidase